MVGQHVIVVLGCSSVVCRSPSTPGFYGVRILCFEYYLIGCFVPSSSPSTLHAHKLQGHNRPRIAFMFAAYLFLCTYSFGQPERPRFL